MNGRHLLEGESKPRLTPHVRLRFDEKRDRWVVLAPERLYVPDEIAIEVLKLCDGKVSVGEMIEGLAERYQASRKTIEKDVLELLQGLADEGILVP
ncbi:MAG: pyrroloquinoline quinone biosynthesis peptide chaperone PqqD [Pseudomonadota bacterium]